MITIEIMHFFFAVAQDIQQQGLPKNFDPLESEQKLYDWWEKNGYFSPNEAATGEPFTISMPPPNVTGKLHMGHAMFVTLQDIMARFQRMRGRPTFWVPGTDHAGIATQMVVERMLTEKGMTRQSMGRDAFEQEVWKWKEQYGGYITQQLRRLGASCDWTKERFTLDEGLCGEFLYILCFYICLDIYYPRVQLDFAAYSTHIYGNISEFFGGRKCK